MKKLLLFSGLLFTILFTSCDNELHVNADWKDITVIYGLLDPDEDTNWVRVQRAYLGSEAASVSFNNPDSLYYDTVAVYLKAYENINGAKGNFKDSIWLTKDATSKKLEEGTFTTEGFHLYRTQRRINPDYIYEIIVKKPGTRYPDASSTAIIVGRPDGNEAGTSPSETFRFVQPNRNIREFNGNIQWYANSNTFIYEIDAYIRYKEINRTTGEVKHLVQEIDYGLEEGNEAEADAGTRLDLGKLPTHFYQEMASSFPPLEGNSLRFIKDMTFVVWAGGEDLATYISLNKPTLGVNNNQPEFPDIENGIGLFSSRTKTVIDGINFTEDLNSNFYLTGTLCDHGFAIITSGDTCYCNQFGEKTCF